MTIRRTAVSFLVTGALCLAGFLGVATGAGAAVATPSLTTTSSGGGTQGNSFTDSATLSGFASNLGGGGVEAVSFSLYPTLAHCNAGTSALSGSPVTAFLSSGGVTPQSSGGIAVNTAGTYYWQASYLGDANNNAATSSCSSEPITVTNSKTAPSLTTTSSGNGTIAGAFTDSATLSGFAGTVTGETVSFRLYSSVANCTAGTPVAGGPVTALLSSGGITPQSSAITVNTAGTYYWQASYPGDANNNPVTSSCSSEPITVGSGTPLPIQIWGTDAIGTTIAISQAEFPTAGTAGAVVLARDDFFSDALSGGPLAAAVGGPLLITSGASISSTLDPRVLAEIQRVLPPGGTVYVLGGNLALSPNIDATLIGLGYHVIREAGTDEFATSYDIAFAMGSPRTIIEATGLSFFDALSAVPAAIQQHAAILLTNGNAQAFVTGIYIVGHPGITRYAVGGPLAAYGADPGAIPVYGQDLFATSNAVATMFFPGATIFGAATAATFTDALGGGVFMATGGRMGALLLVNTNAPLPTEILPYLNSLAVGTQGYVFGGPYAVGATALTALQQAVG